MKSSVHSLTHTFSLVPLWLQTTAIMAAGSEIITPRCGSNYDKSLGFDKGRVV